MKKIICLALSLCLMFLAAGCNFLIKNDGSDRLDYPVTVGNIVFDSAPTGVVVLSENLADVIIACGYEGKLSGRSDACSQKGIERLPSVGTPDSPDMEKLREISPELIITDAIFEDSVKEKITALGAEIMVVKPAYNKNELSTLYSNLASVLGGGYSGKMKAMDTIDSIEGELDSMKNEVSGEEVISTACYIYEMNGDQCRVVYGSCYASDLFEYAHLTNIASDDEDGYIGTDVLLRGNPDTIFCDSGIAEKIYSNNDLRSLSAVSGGRVFTVPEKYIMLQGKTCLTAVDFMIAKTHEGYTPKQEWPEEFEVEEEKPVFVAPFEPKEGIFYTIGETYSPIKDIEQRLIDLGYMEGEADETYTEETAVAVSAFQELNGLNVTGIADYETQSVLLSEDAVPMS